jgi:hypothetical protein
LNATTNNLSVNVFWFKQRKIPRRKVTIAVTVCISKEKGKEKIYIFEKCSKES